LLNFIGSLSLLAFQYVLLCYWTSIISVTHFTLMLGFIDWGASGSTIFSSFKQLLLFIIVNIYDVNPHPDAQLDRIFSLFIITRDDVESMVLIWRLSDLVSLLPTLIRLLIISIFFSSFVIRGVQRPIMDLWERIVVSDQPIFT